MNTPIRIKTFRSKTLQEAIQQVRIEFGPDASILETKAARYGIFGSRIEVTASTQMETGQINAAETPANIEQQNESVENFESPQLIPIESDSTDQKSGSKNGLSSTSRNENSTSPELAKTERVLGQVHQELIDAGIDQGIAGQWIDAARTGSNAAVLNDVWTLRSELQHWIRDWVHAAPPVAFDGTKQHVIALIGPTGAGKTTTLAKIAANLTMEHGFSVGVLSTDWTRRGSNQLLENYAEVLGWRFEVAESIERVASCMAGFADHRFVFIDTCGCSSADDEGLEQIGQFLQITKPTETHLVISSTCNVRSFLRYEHAFEKLNPNRMVVTKIDESGGLGSFFPCIQNSTLPISFLTNGRQIPSDLIQATDVRLAQQIMALPDNQNA